VNWKNLTSKTLKAMHFNGKGRDVAPCNHVEVDGRFRGVYSIIRAMTEAVRTSEKSVNFNVTTRRYIPEDSKLHTRRREKLKSHKTIHFPTFEYTK
jgi:hypothetical protein